MTNDDLKDAMSRVDRVDVRRLRLRRDRSLVETAAVLGYLGAVATHVLNRLELPASIDQIRDNTGLSKTRILRIVGDLEARDLVRVENAEVRPFAGLTSAGKKLYFQAHRKVRSSGRGRARVRA